MLVRRELEYSGNDLITIYRPRTFDEFIGNAPVVTSLKNYLAAGKLPHTLLFSGNSGCGKTTAARIIACSLNCLNIKKDNTPCLECSACTSIIKGNNFNVVEVNAGQDSGKNDVADITSHLSLAPLNAKCRVVIFDEAHALSSGAKDALLKVMEDSYSHVYIIFCTNEPEKLRIKGRDDNPFMDRCSQFNFGRIDYDSIKGLIENIIYFEGQEPVEEIVSFLANKANGIPRKAIKDLDKVLVEASWNIINVKQLFDEDTSEDDPRVISLCKSILHEKLSDSLDQLTVCLKYHPPESIRLAITGYLVGCLKRVKEVNNRNSRYISTGISIFSEPLMFDYKTSQHKLYNMIFRTLDYKG